MSVGLLMLLIWELVRQHVVSRPFVGILSHHTSMSHRDLHTAQIFEYNGAAIVAMAGKECVAIGSDLRFGVQFQTLACDFKKVYRIHDHLYLGLAGLGTDAQTL